jgi:hypothetical protein
MPGMIAWCHLPLTGCSVQGNERMEDWRVSADPGSDANKSRHSQDLRVGFHYWYY